MGIPTHFGSSIIQRTLKLLTDYEPEIAQRKDRKFGGPLTTTWLLTFAMPLLVIPIERYLRADLRQPQYEDGTSAALKAKMNIILGKPFEQAPFFVGTSWREARQPAPFVHPLAWTENFRTDLFGANGLARVLDSSAIDLITFIRHSLAHGAVAYLDAEGTGTAGQPAAQFAFVSTSAFDAKRRPIEYAIIVVSEMDFSQFLRKWAEWILNIEADVGIPLEA